MKPRALAGLFALLLIGGGVLWTMREGGRTERSQGREGGAPAVGPRDKAPSHGSRILGSVRNEHGAAVQGAEISAKQTDAQVVHATEVHEDGGYALDLPPGSYEVHAWTPGHWPPRPQAVEVAAGDEARCDFVAHRGWSFRGTYRGF